MRCPNRAGSGREETRKARGVANRAQIVLLPGTAPVPPRPDSPCRAVNQTDQVGRQSLIGVAITKSYFAKLGENLIYMTRTEWLRGCLLRFLHNLLYREFFVAIGKEGDDSSDVDRVEVVAPNLDQIRAARKNVWCARMGHEAVSRNHLIQPPARTALDQRSNWSCLL
jgi:hypothetical protein